jgi:hypothetical protein
MGSIYVALDHSEGEAFIVGVWDARDFTEDDVKQYIISEYISDCGCEPEFSSRGIEISFESIKHEG